MEWLIREYMTKRHIKSFTELSKMAGIEYRTLLNHISDVGLFRVYEIAALDSVLGFNDEDLLKFMREEK